MSGKIRSKPSRQQQNDIILLSLARGENISKTARLASVSSRTVSRRLEDDEFQAQVRKLRADMVARAAGQLCDASIEAALKLRELLNAESESIQLAAARSILEIGCKLRECVELEERISELETRIDAKNQH